MVVVAAPAQFTATSQRIHSIRVLLAMATRSSGATPMTCRPAAILLTRSPTSFQVIHTRPLGPGYENALASGVSATRARNISEMDLYGICTCAVIGRGALRSRHVSGVTRTSYRMVRMRRALDQTCMRGWAYQSKHSYRPRTSSAFRYDRAQAR